MAIEPEIISRRQTPYLGITDSVRMSDLGPRGGALSGELFGWLAAHEVAPAGALIWKYNAIHSDGLLELEVCLPVDAPVDAPVVALVESGASVHNGVLPAGRYAEYLHRGHPDRLLDATRDLLEWADSTGHSWAKDGERWVARLEEYLSDPAEEPDMDQWRTRLAFLLAD